MENSAYVPGTGHMSTPALVVFSQAAGGLTEALHIQRPFNPQVISLIQHYSVDSIHLSLNGLQIYTSIKRD